MTPDCCRLASELECLVEGGPEEELQALEEHVLSCDLCTARLDRLVADRTPLPGLFPGRGTGDLDAECPPVAALMRQLTLLGRSLPRAAPPFEEAPPPAAEDATDLAVLARTPGGQGPAFVGSSLDATLEGEASHGSHQDPSLISFLAPPQSPGEIGRLGKYRVLKVLGAGGMGIVFQAEDPQLERHVALKALRPALATDPIAAKRFFREARLLAAVEHDHVVRVLEVDLDRGVPYLAMELLRGEPLDVRLEREKHLPVPEIVRIGREVAEGLAAAHARGLVHRDVKPSNVWLEAATGRVKILDFGLARPVEEPQGFTQQGAIAGTPAYMAPEQARGDRVDPRSDLFSLGVLLYRAGCGMLPFQGRDTVSTLMAVVTCEPPAPHRANPEQPRELSDLVMQLLQKDPDRRPASAAAVAEALRGQERRLRGPQPPESIETLPGGKPRHGRLLRAGALIVLSLLIGVGVWASGVLRFQSDRGDLVLESDDQDFTFSPSGDGGLILKDRKARRTYRVRAVPLGKDEHELEVTDVGAESELNFKSKTFTVKRGGTVALKAWFERKPPAAAAKADQPAGEEAWLRHVAALPAEKKLEAVVARLKERNPAWDGKFKHHLFSRGELVQVQLSALNLFDVSPLRAWPALEHLICQGFIDHKVPSLKDLSPLASLKLRILGLPFTDVSDLRPLKGMPLENLNLDGTRVTDLSPLAGMPLKTLSCTRGRVEDLSPVAGLPLRSLSCDFRPERDTALLRSIKTLERINNKPAAEFWSEVGGRPRVKDP